jgi:hypothetical protein
LSFDELVDKHAKYCNEKYALVMKVCTVPKRRPFIYGIKHDSPSTLGYGTGKF